MIYFLTALPGGGKSLKAVEMMEQWVAEGRAVYSNVAGLRLPGVSTDFPDDWRETPEGSVWVCDEAQKLFPATGKAGVSERQDVRAMEEHRHTGHDLVLITQHPTFVHHHIRKLVGRHFHMERHTNKAATVYAWDGTGDVGDHHARRNADKTIWKYPQRLFGMYDSATAHTHKFRIPRKFVALGSVMLGLLGVAAYSFANLDFGAASEPEAAPQPVTRTEPEPSPAGPITARRGSSSGGGNFALVGGRPQSLDGAELTNQWRIAGRITGGSEQVFMLKSVHGDHQMVPDDGWRVIAYRNGLLKVGAPGGDMLVSWVTNTEDGTAVSSQRGKLF